MRILGIDPGSAQLGVVILEGDNILYSMTLKAPMKGVKRLNWYNSCINNLIDKHSVTDAVIEGYSYMSKWRAHDLGEIGGIMRLLLHKKKIPFRVVPPPTLKKFTAGKGNIKKEMMMLFAYKKWNVEFNDTHQCDAYALCRWYQSQKDKVGRNDFI